MTSEVELNDVPMGDVEVGQKKTWGPSLHWKGVNFSVGSKQILSDLSGEVSSENTCAILGPSGCGKTSLMNVLAGRLASRAPDLKVSIEMKVDGIDTNPVDFKKNVAYVMQDDALLPTVTPREALAFSAALRLSKVSAADRHHRVEMMLKDLDLEKCADVFIGSALVPGISGGQRKRTSIGIELVTDPSLIFLDEPTSDVESFSSGLDSEAALNCITLLKAVARKGATVLCTIHQPSSEAFSLFDRVVLMKEGQSMFQGRVAEVVPFFADRGYEPPVHHNTADYIMNVASRNTTEALRKAGFFAAVPPSSSPSSGGDKQRSSLDSRLEVARAPLTTQVSLLVRREFQAAVRNKGALKSRFGIVLVLSTLYGLIFRKAGGRDSADPENLSSHFGGVMIAAFACMVLCTLPVMLSFPLERPVFLREYTTGTYGLASFLVGKSLVELPLVFLQTLLQYALVYPLMDLQGNFGLLVTASWALGIASSSIAILLGCSRSDVKTVVELAPAVFVPQILFAGFFIRIAQIPSYLRWAQYLCALKYCVNLLLLIEFKDCGATSDTPNIARMACKKLYETNEIDRDDTLIYWAVLVGLFIGFRVLASFALVHKARNFF